MIEKIKFTTRHPSENYSANKSFPHLKERISATAPKRRLQWWKYAAAAASIAVLFTIWQYGIRQPAENQLKTYEYGAHSERERFLLPDGSLVWLNAESRLTYTDAFDTKTREAKLTGEAYFEVTKDARRPFTVHVNESRVEVLGTVFNVRAYPDEHEIVTTLVEGSVRFGKTPSDMQGIILKPEQQLFFYKDNESAVVRSVDCSPYISWKDGRLVFRQTPVKEAFAIMEQTFGIKITTTNTLLDNRKITGNFGADEKPEHVLSVMQELLPFMFEVKADTIIIK